MKFVKRAAVFSVLCLAAYGAFALLNNKEPQVHISESDLNYLEQELGIYVQDGQATESGQSSIFGELEGVAPVGGSTGPTSSSVPPSFLLEPTTSSIPPPFIGAVPRVAAASPEPDFFTPATDTFPPLNFAEPADIPRHDTPSQPLPFEVPPLEPPTIEAPAVPATESPPPQTESWDGPASDISKTPPPSAFLEPPNSSPSPNAPVLANLLPPAQDKIVYLPAEQNIRTIGFHEPKKEKTDEPPPTPSKGAEFAQCPSCGGELSQSAHCRAAVVINESFDANPSEYFLAASDTAYSTTDSVPLDTFSIQSADVRTPDSLHHDPALRYTKTSDRQPLTFEPVKPAVSPNAPVVTFAAPKRSEPAPPQPEQPQQLALTNPVVKQIGTIRTLENHADSPAVQTDARSPVQESVVRFIQSQRLLAESEDPEKIRLAFIQLSQLYEHDQLGESERLMMQPILDMLALHVIYAKETHILEPPYRVKPGETLESIAEDYKLTPELLRKINGLTMTQEPAAGTTLKVLYGQFDARISFKRKELTLLLGGLYAGRFPFESYDTAMRTRGEELYVKQRTDRVVVLNNGWILSTALTRNASIIFADKDAREVFDILSELSVIVLE